EWGDIVAVSGSLAATGESDYSISVRRLTDGAEVRRLRGHTGKITAIVVLPELHTLISASQDRSVRFWNLETGQVRGDALPLHRFYVRALAANDHIAVSCGDADEAIVWIFDEDGATKAGELKPFEGWNFSAEALRGKSYGMAGRATSVVMDDRIIAVGHADGIVCLYRCDTFAQVGVLGAFNPSPAGTSEIVAMALSEEGILVTGAKDGQVRVWSIEDALMQMQPPPMADQISGMGHREPEASFKGIGRSVGQGHNTLVALAFMPENPKHIIVASRDGFVTYWDWNRSTLISSKSHGTGKLSSLAVGEDVIIVGGCDRVAIIRPVGAEEPSQEIQQQQGEPRLSRKTRRSRSSNARAHFSWLLGSHPEWGRLVVMNEDFVVCSGVDNSICVRGRADPEEDVHVLEGHTGTVSRLALHGSILASSSFRDGTIRIWDLRTGELTLKIQDDFTRNILVLAINEKHVAAARCDTVYMWSLRNGRREMLEATGESGSWVRALAMNDEILVVGYASGKVKVFSKSGLLENELEEHDQGVGAVVLHGHQIATGGEIDGRIKLWDYRAHNFEKLGEFVDPHPHGKRITSLAMDEHVLVEGSDDFMVSLWERSTETLIARCNVGVESVESVALADGLVVCAGNNKTVFAAPRDGFEGFCDSGRTSRRWNRVQVVYDLAAPFVRAQDESQDSAFSRHSPDVASVDEVSSLFGSDSDHDEAKELDAAEDDAALAAEDAASLEDLASDATSTPNGSSSGAKLCGVHPDRGNLVVMNKSFLVSSGSSRSGSIRVYDRKTGDECFVLGNDGAPVSLMVLHGDKLASWSFKEKCIRVWSLKAQTQKLCITKNAKNLVALAMNSKLMAGAKGAVVLVWSLSDGKKRFELQPRHARKDSSKPDIRALVMDCKIIVTGDTAGHVHVYSCAAGKHLMYHDRHSHGVSALALRGRLVASAGECDHRIQVWDWRGEADDLGDFAVHSDRVSSLAFGDEVLVVGSDDYTVSTWDVIRSFLIARRNIKVGCVESIALEDGLLACAGSTGTTYVTILQDFEHSNERRTSRRWTPIKLPAATGIEMSPHPFLNHPPALDSKEVDDALRKISGLNTLALSDEIIAVAEKDALRIHDSLRPRLAPVQVPCEKEVTALILGETDEILGTSCVIGCVDGSIGLLHLQKLDQPRISKDSFLSEDGHKHRVTCIAESRDYIVSGDASGTLCVWDKDSLLLEDCYSSNEGPISAVVISSCGVHVYSADVNGRIFHWNRYGGDNSEFVNVAGIPLVLALDKKSLVARVSRASGEDAATSRAGEVYAWSRKKASRPPKRSSRRTDLSRGCASRTHKSVAASFKMLEIPGSA
ncbi:Guanine nucleotide-binding protein subunit beta-1, partial [Hondaea fermentalgiana]